MSFPAKVEAAVLAVFVILPGWYFLQLVAQLRMVPVANIDYEASLLAVIVGMVAAIVAASVVIGSRSARRGEDLQQGREVDTLIARRGDQLAGYVLVFGIVLGMGLAMSGAAALWIANGLFAAAVAAGITRSAFVVYTYLIHRHARQKLPPQSY